VISRVPFQRNLVFEALDEPARYGLGPTFLPETECSLEISNTQKRLLKLEDLLQEDFSI